MLNASKQAKNSQSINDHKYADLLYLVFSPSQLVEIFPLICGTGQVQLPQRNLDLRYKDWSERGLV